MSKWKCADYTCGNKCEASDEFGLKPRFCFHTGAKKDWEPVEPASNPEQFGNSEQLPEKIKGFVEKSLDETAKKMHDKIIKHPYDLPKQPTTDCSQLPDWCKVGEWVWSPCDGGCYCRVSEIDGNRIFTKHRNESICFHIDKGDDFSSLRLCEARLRPYNADEMKDLIGKVIVEKKSGDIGLVTGYCNRKESVYAGKNDFVADLLLSDYTINGSPCGVLEHLENGEWVE